MLAHEQAHLSQRHHLVTWIVTAIARWFRWVPLIAAIEDALPHYLEIAADDEARRQAGTSALVGALLKLGDGIRTEQSRAGALHANGPHRIRQLVQPTTGSVGVLPTAVATVCTAGLAVASAAAHLPYVLSALNGCI